MAKKAKFFDGKNILFTLKSVVINFLASFIVVPAILLARHNIRAGTPEIATLYLLAGGFAYLLFWGFLWRRILKIK